MGEQPSQSAAYVLMEVGIQPWKASSEEIKLAELILKKHRYIESAAEEFKLILTGSKNLAGSKNNG